MDIQPRRGVPAAPNSCKIKATVLGLLPKEKSPIQTLQIMVLTIIEGSSPFIQSDTTALATTNISAQLSPGDKFEAKAEYIGDEWGGKIRLSEIQTESN